MPLNIEVANCACSFKLNINIWHHCKWWGLARIVVKQNYRIESSFSKATWLLCCRKHVFIYLICLLLSKESFKVWSSINNKKVKYIETNHTYLIFIALDISPWHTLSIRRTNQFEHTVSPSTMETPCLIYELKLTSSSLISKTVLDYY